MRALPVQTLYEDCLLTWHQLTLVLSGSGRPTELLTKRLAMAGVVLLVLAHSLRDVGGGAVRTYAGGYPVLGYSKTCWYISDLHLGQSVHMLLEC